MNSIKEHRTFFVHLHGTGQPNQSTFPNQFNLNFIPTHVTFRNVTYKDNGVQSIFIKCDHLADINQDKIFFLRSDTYNNLKLTSKLDFGDSRNFYLTFNVSQINDASYNLNGEVTFYATFERHEQ